jgi:phosphomannomutase/phosphoglucomutase
MNRAIFRQYDIRGIAESELTHDVVALLGRALATHVGAGAAAAPTVAVGRDVRLSSPRLRDALLRGLGESGANVIDIGEVPTPVLYHAAAIQSADAGVMITGSHNPIEYNGFKLVRGGNPVYGEEIQTLAALMEAGRFSSGAGQVRSIDPYPAYRAEVEPKLRADRPLQVAVDCGNGAGSLLAVSLLRSLGHEVEPLYCEPDGRFPNHLPDPTIPALMRDLAALVVRSGADVGLGFDGDADRVGAVDDRGRLVFGDQLLALLARDLLERHPGASVLFDVKCSRGLMDEITARGGVPVMGPTGHSLMKARMKRDHILLGGEMSGHMFLAEGYRGYDDALFAGARLLQAIGRWGRPLSALVEGLPHYESTPEIRVDCPDERKFEIVAELASRFRAAYRVVDIDGARVEFEDGWGLVRASNTQPILVLRFEARSRGRLEAIRKVFYDALKAFPDVDLAGLEA